MCQSSAGQWAQPIKVGICWNFHGARADWRPCPVVGASSPNGLAQICIRYIADAGPRKPHGRNQGWRLGGIMATSKLHPRLALAPGPPNLPKNSLPPSPRPETPPAQEWCTGSLYCHCSIDSNCLHQCCYSSTNVHVIYGMCMTALDTPLRSGTQVYLLACPLLAIPQCLILMGLLGPM